VNTRALDNLTVSLHIDSLTLTISAFALAGLAGIVGYWLHRRRDATTGSEPVDDRPKGDT
jgi:MYXO-CTERM domain-containing protein